MKTPPEIILVVLCCALMAAVGQIFLKLASGSFGFNLKGTLGNFKFLIGIGLYATSALLFVWALKFGNLSILYQLVATSHIWVVILSFTILDEPFSSLKWLGIALIILGIVLIVN